LAPTQRPPSFISLSDSFFSLCSYVAEGGLGANKMTAKEEWAWASSNIFLFSGQTQQKIKIFPNKHLVNICVSMDCSVFFLLVAASFHYLRLFLYCKYVHHKD
jgi:hypothetical protein